MSVVFQFRKKIVTLPFVEYGTAVGDIPKVAPKTEQFSAPLSIVSSSISGAWQKDENDRKTLSARKSENCETSEV